MDQRHQAGMDDELEKERARLRCALSALTEGVSRPPALSAEALFARMQEEGEAAHKRAAGRRTLPFVRIAAAAAAVVVLSAGALLAFGRQGMLPQLTDNTAGGAASSAAAVQAGAPDAGETASGGGAAPADGEAASKEGEAEAAQEKIAADADIPAPAAYAPPEEAADMPISSAADGAQDAAANAPSAREEAAADEKAQAFSGISPRMALSSAEGSLPQINDARAQDGGEGDILDQDAHYLYYLAAPAGERRSSTLFIIQSEELKAVSSLEAADARAVFVRGDRLALVSSGMNLSAAPEEETQADAGLSVSAQIYDISDRSSPTLTRTFEQEGGYALSAMVDDSLCLVTTASAEREGAADPAGETGAAQPAAPRVRDSLRSGDAVLEEGDLLIPDGAGQPVWTTVSLLSLEDEAPAASAALYGGADSLLLAENQLYLAGRIGEEERSALHRYSLSEGAPVHAASGEVEGVVELRGALASYGGELRATVRSGEHAGLALFDEALRIRVSLPQAVPAGELRAVQYTESAAYFQTLGGETLGFAVEGDRISALGAVPLPAEVELRRLPDGSYFCLQDAMPQQESARGLRLTVYDLRDPTAPREKASALLPAASGYSEASFDRRALLAREDLIGFPALLYEDEDGGTRLSGSAFYLYRYSGDALHALGTFTHLTDPAQYAYENDHIRRAALVGNRICTLADGLAVLSDMESGAVVARQELR